jgi:ribonuclease-3
MEITRIEPPPLDKNEIDLLVGTKVKDISLYRRAFLHKSATKKYITDSNFETLEFIGDSVLGFVITKFLFDKYEHKQEGFLTRARTKLVRGETLAKIASAIQLDKFILMDDKGMRNNWNCNPKVLEDAFEALVGAIYLDLGMIHAKHFILNIFNDKTVIDLGLINQDDNYKDILMRWCQSKHMELPEYQLISHERGVFTISVSVDGVISGIGKARNKKAAEQTSARMALDDLDLKGIVDTSTQQDGRC